MFLKLALCLMGTTAILAGPTGSKVRQEVRKPRGQHYLPAYDDAALGDYGLVPEVVLPAKLDSYAAPSGHGHHTKTGYSVGGGLVAIARGAADQARTQVNNQHAAAGQAAYVAKNTLAQGAAQSAATAAAALAGKQIILSGLEQQSRDAYVAVDGEKMQLQQAQRAATAARNAAQQAMHQLQVVTAALNAAQATSDHAAQAAAEAAAELAAQTTMVGQAKARAETIDKQLKAAQVDFVATQSASDKAAAAAQLAQNNAAAAAAHAVESGATSTHPLPSVAEEEDGHHEATAVLASHEHIPSHAHAVLEAHDVLPSHGHAVLESHEHLPSRGHAPAPAAALHDTALLQSVQYADDSHDQYVVHRNSLAGQNAYGPQYSAHADGYDYKGYF